MEWENQASLLPNFYLVMELHTYAGTIMIKKEIIAEIGSVHDGSIGNAMKLIDCASDCGAHTVKFQLHISSEEI